MVPNYTYYSYQWHMPAISTESAWDLNSGSGVLVRIIDTGVAYEDYGSYQQAPDLAGPPYIDESALVDIIHGNLVLALAAWSFRTVDKNP